MTNPNADKKSQLIIVQRSVLSSKLYDADHYRIINDEMNQELGLKLVDFIRNDSRPCIPHIFSVHQDAAGNIMQSEPVTVFYATAVMWLFEPSDSTIDEVVYKLDVSRQGTRFAQKFIEVTIGGHEGFQRIHL